MWKWTVNQRNQCLYHGLTGLFYTIGVIQGNNCCELKFLPLTSLSCQSPRSSLVIEIDLKPNRYTNISSLRRAFVSVFSVYTQSSVQFVWPKHKFINIDDISINLYYPSINLYYQLLSFIYLSYRNWLVQNSQFSTFSITKKKTWFLGLD